MLTSVAFDSVGISVDDAFAVTAFGPPKIGEDSAEVKFSCRAYICLQSRVLIPAVFICLSIEPYVTILCALKNVDCWDTRMSVKVVW